MTAVLFFLALRALHVLVAGLWIGSTVFMTFLLEPAVDGAGASGGHVMMRINQRGMATYFAGLGFSTIATGLYLLWRFTGGFDAGVAATHAGLAFCAGGLSGILAGVVGGGVVGRTAEKIMITMRQALTLADGPAKGALMEQVAGLRHRAHRAAKVVVALQAFALVMMAVGHYV
jgi:hypothetical protein